jgi:hypothetical protein
MSETFPAMLLLVHRCRAEAFRHRDAVNAGSGIVMPYACSGDDGAPAWSVGADGFGHWCLLFGYAEYSKVSRARS